MAVGVMVIVATALEVAELEAVKAEMSPEPLAPSPIEVLLFVQLNVVPLTTLEKFTVLVEAPLQIFWLPGVLTVGVGLTVIVKDVELPVQPSADGVMVIFATELLVPELVAVKEAILPAPLVPSPIDALLFIQLNVTPVGVPEKLTALVDAPLQSV